MPSPSLRRLRRLGLQLGADTPMAASGLATARTAGGGWEDAIHELLPLPLIERPLNGKDWIQADCSAVHESISRAAADGDFRLAAALQDLLFVAEPKPPLSVAECAPTDPDAAAAFFIENGFVCVEQLFDPATLLRIQQAWNRAQAPARALWEESKSMGTGHQGLSFENQAEISSDPRFQNLPHGRLYFDIPVEDYFFAEALEPDGDPVLLDMIDPPKLLAVLEKIVGEDVICVGVQPRTVPPEDEGGYTTWHNDSHAGAGWEQEQLGRGVAKRTVKAFIYINDVAEDQGCTSVVRGSHKLSPLGISANTLFDWNGSGESGQSVFAGNDVGRTVADGFAPMGSMPNSVKFAAKAGDCCIFDLATFHTAQPNTSTMERWNTIQGYHSASVLGLPGGGTPTGPIMGDEMLKLLDEGGRLSSTKRRLLHMPIVEGEVEGAGEEWPRYNARGQLRGTAQVDGSAQR
jgi:hypothetical protein